MGTAKEWASTERTHRHRPWTRGSGDELQTGERYAIARRMLEAASRWCPFSAQVLAES